MEHVRDDLSAYLDGALARARRSEVDAHLTTCAACQAALAGLRSTARLISALPLSVPSRRLVPALAPRTSWLRPLRSLSAVAAGAFLLVFMASATLDTGFRMGGGGATATAGRLIGGPTPAPAALEAAPRTDTVSGGTAGTSGQAGAAGSPAPQGLGDAQRQAAPSTAVPKAVAPRSSSADQPTSVARGSRTAVDAPEPVRLGTPWLWLGLALLSAALAALAHRRLRAR